MDKFETDKDVILCLEQAHDDSFIGTQRLIKKKNAELSLPHISLL